MRVATVMHFIHFVLILAQMDIESPYLFEVSNTGVNLADMRTSHAGVLEFIAEEGHVHLPAWVRQCVLNSLNLISA